LVDVYIFDVRTASFTIDDALEAIQQPHSHQAAAGPAEGVASSPTMEDGKT
jgi:hypothetical protein